MKQLLLVGSGGFIGSVGRYLVGGAVHRLIPFSLMPYGTMTVNIAGCFLIGFLGGWSEVKESFSPEVRLFVFIGILGGFTTFSSFALETLNLARDSDLSRAFVNVAVQVIVCLAAVWMGHALGRSL